MGDCKTCSKCGGIPCEHQVGGGSSAPGQTAIIDVLAAAVRTIPPMGWSEDVQVPPSQVPIGEFFVTLNGARGSSLARVTSAYGESILQHGVPCVVKAPITVAVAAADRTSFVVLQAANWPIRLSTITYREVSKRLAMLAGITPATATPENSLVIHPGSQQLIVQAFATSACSVTMQEIIDAGNGTVALGAAVTIAVAANTPTTGAPVLSHAPYLLSLNPVAGGTFGWVRVLQPMGGA